MVFECLRCREAETIIACRSEYVDYYKIVTKRKQRMRIQQLVLSIEGDVGS